MRARLRPVAVAAGLVATLVGAGCGSADNGGVVTPGETTSTIPPSETTSTTATTTAPTTAF